MTSEYDISRRRLRVLRWPACSRARDRLDHPVAEMALQFAQPHEIRQPPAHQDPAVPAATAGAVTTGRQNTAS
jgi:hypothetical protein